MKKNLTIDLYSFGYQFSGIPEDLSGHNGGFVFDCRFLPNPGRDAKFSHRTGKDKAVKVYLEQFPEVHKFLETAKAMIDLAIANYLKLGFTHLMISFGCTGGQHRSVYCAEQIKKYLHTKPLTVKLHHTELTIN